MWHFITVSTVRACFNRQHTHWLFCPAQWLLWPLLKDKPKTQSWETEAVWSLTKDERHSGDVSAASLGKEISARFQPWDPAASGCLEMYLKSWESLQPFRSSPLTGGGDSLPPGFSLDIYLLATSLFKDPVSRLWTMRSINKIKASPNEK